MAADADKLREEAVRLQAAIFQARQQLLDNTLVNTCADVEQIHTLQVRGRRRLAGHSGKIYDACWCPGDGRYLVSAGQEGNLIVWDAYLGEKADAIHLDSPWVLACAYSRAGDKVASGGLDNVVTVYDVNTDGGGDSDRQGTTLKGHKGFVSKTRFVGDNKLLSSSGDGELWLWDIARRQPVTKLKGHENDVTSFGVRDEATAVSCSLDKTCKVWDLRMGQCTSTMGGHTDDINALTMHPCGEAFATASRDGSVRMWSLTADQQIEHYSRDSHEQPPIEDDCHTLTFSKSGRVLFVSTSQRVDETKPLERPPENSVLIWDTLTGDLFMDRMLQTKASQNRVAAMEVSPDGFGLCTAGWDGVVNIWSM